MDDKDERGLDGRSQEMPKHGFLLSTKSSFLLSTLALIFGWLLLLGSCAQIVGRIEDPTAEVSINPLLGLQIILGALAYRSVKRTKLEIREESVLRRIGELLALIFVWYPNIGLVLASWGGFTDNQALLNKIAYEPAEVFFVHVMVPLWSYIAYLVIVMKQPQMAAVDEEPKGLGGWLIPAAISLCITPIVLVVSVMRDFLPIFQEGYWDILTTPGSEVYHPLWGPLIVFEIIGNAFFIIFSIILILLFFTKSYRFPTLMIVFIASSFLFGISDFFLADLIPAVASEGDGEFVKELFKAIISAMIWIPYLLSSKRVKNAFVKQNSNEPLQSS